jgi:hypothetical protein
MSRKDPNPDLKEIFTDSQHWPGLIEEPVSGEGMKGAGKNPRQWISLYVYTSSMALSPLQVHTHTQLKSYCSN